VSVESQQDHELKVKRMVDVGDEAPDFEGRDDSGELVKLSDFRGKKNVLLVFYPYAFTRTCTSEFCTLRDDNVDLCSDTTEVIGISCDSVGTLRAWKKSEGYVNRFVSDFWPHGEISKRYGAFDDRLGAPVRCTFLIDKAGAVRYVERNTIETLGVARDQQAWREAIATLG
jgi:peroxiredoxin